MEKSTGFTGPFAICTFLFLLMIFGPLSWLKFAPSWLKLAYLIEFEPKLSQVGTKLAQVGSKLGPSWLHVGSSWAHVGPKLAPSWLKLSPSWLQRRSCRVLEALLPVSERVLEVPWGASGAKRPKIASNLTQVFPCWTHFWVPSYPWANPSPSKPY